MSEKRLLYVFAHPDDETFTSGVTIAKYAHEGGTTQTLLCATRGEAGKAGQPPICSPEQLPQVREEELRTAAAILGMDHVEVLDYQDKHVSEVPLSELVNRIQQTIAQVQPQVVVTFAPHGISGHPDHIAISKATYAAVAGHPTVRKLYYCTHSADRKLPSGRKLFTDPPERITTQIVAPQYVPLVAQALAAHRTQHLSVESVFPGVFSGDHTHVPAVNSFILAWHNLPNYQLTDKEDDLFSGIPLAAEEQQ